MQNKETDMLDEKFNMLIDSISSENNTSGSKGCYIRAGEFQKIYNKKYPRHPDYRGFSWNTYIKRKAREGFIKIYLKYPGGRKHYYVLNSHLDQFLKIYPNGVSVV